MIGFLASAPVGSIDMAEATKLIEALTPLLQGPTAGLVTVLLLILGIGWGVTAKVLPAWRAVVDKQNSVLVNIQLALEALTAQVNGSHSSITSRLDRVEIDLESVVREVGGLRRDVKSQAKVVP